jgi:1-acyl-sn-glycerol-3-phosphate acyltransferase
MHSYKVTHTGPVSGVFQYWLGRILLWFLGWEVEGRVPPGSKFILIGAPHTSNWDFLFSIATLYIFRLKISWMGKETLFKRPFGGFMKWLGGIPINRESEHGVVEQIVKQFKESQRLVIVISPSGTRKKMDHWKSGFYWIAHTAEVPVLCGYLDYNHKKAGLGLSFILTGDVKKDMDRIRKFYSGIQGKHSELVSKIRLINENN